MLPHCEEKDLDRLEAELQLKEDLKAEYSWTSQALMMREKMDRFDYKEDEISAIYGFKKGDLQELLDCLEYADDYLTSRSTPRTYSSVDGKEFAFRQICRSRKKVKSPREREVFEKSAFCLTDDAAEGTRTYAEIQKAAEHLSDITDDLVEEFEVDADDKSGDEVAEVLAEILSQEENYDRARENNPGDNRIGYCACQRAEKRSFTYQAVSLTRGTTLSMRKRQLMRPPLVMV